MVISKSSLGHDRVVYISQPTTFLEIPTYEAMQWFYNSELNLYRQCGPKLYDNMKKVYCCQEHWLYMVISESFLISMNRKFVG